MEKTKFYYNNELLSSANEYYSYDESTVDIISSQPLLIDRYEQMCCYVKESSIPNSGEGLFAKVHLPANIVVSFYNGTRQPGNWVNTHTHIYQ